MPTDAENTVYLYLVLTHGGAPTINWDAVGAEMDLKKGAVSKRWSRLKQAMEKGEQPGPSVYNFLWTCLKHSTRDKAMDWSEIAAKCGTTSGAASKRYSRMKQAFEAGATAPSRNSGSPAPKTPSKSTPRKKTAAADGEATPTPKRKRATPKKKPVSKEQTPDDEEEDIKVKPEPDEIAAEEEEVKQTPKKAKVTKAKATPKGPSMQSKTEDEDKDVMDTVEDDDGGADARVDEWLNETA